MARRPPSSTPAPRDGARAPAQPDSRAQGWPDEARRPDGSDVRPEVDPHAYGQGAYGPGQGRMSGTEGGPTSDRASGGTAGDSLEQDIAGRGAGSGHDEDASRPSGSAGPREAAPAPAPRGGGKRRPG